MRDAHNRVPALLSHGLWQRLFGGDRGIVGRALSLNGESYQVVGLVLRQGMSLALMGIVIGVGVAFALTRLIESQLYRVRATDPATFVGVAALLGVTALAAKLVPALRATRVDPAVVLREE